MTYRLKAKVLWRAVRDGFARFSRLVAETGNSDEDLVFRVQKSQLKELHPELEARAPTCPRL